MWKRDESACSEKSWQKNCFGHSPWVAILVTHLNCSKMRHAALERRPGLVTWQRLHEGAVNGKLHDENPLWLTPLMFFFFFF